MTELVEVSKGHYAQVIDIASAIRNQTTLNELLVGDLRDLQETAHRNMQHGTSTERRVWRILYVDCSVLYFIILLAAPTVRQSIALLDRTIIIAGGGDENRLSLILSLISEAQLKFLPPSIPSRKALTRVHHLPVEPLSTARHQVPSIDRILSFLSFQTTHHKRPFVIRGYARDWPALNERPWNSIDYLLSASGPSRVVPVEVGHDYRDNEWRQDMMEWEEFLNALDEEGDSETSPKALYLAQYNLLQQFPSLRYDILVPDFVYCSLSPQDFPSYSAPDHPEGAIINVWLGPRGATSPAHFDPYYNFYAQVVGLKTVWISPPETSKHMEACSLLKRPMEPESSACNSFAPPDGETENTSRVDVFTSIDLSATFPSFAEKVIPEAMSIVLGPGDLLFLPPGWWHGMRSESSSMSVSMWF